MSLNLWPLAKYPFMTKKVKGKILIEDYVRSVVYLDLQQIMKRWRMVRDLLPYAQLVHAVAQAAHSINPQTLNQILSSGYRGPGGAMECQVCKHCYSRCRLYWLELCRTHLLFQQVNNSLDLGSIAKHGVSLGLPKPQEKTIHFGGSRARQSTGAMWKWRMKGSPHLMATWLLR